MTEEPFDDRGIMCIPTKRARTASTAGLMAAGGKVLMQAQSTPPRLVKISAGLYRIDGTRWAIGLTDELVEGPRGGVYGAWELRKWEDGAGWIIDCPFGFRTLREARRWAAEHTERLA